jgi:hypothetical protein
MIFIWKFKLFYLSLPRTIKSKTMNTIEYKGKQYPVRTFKVINPEFGEEQTYTIGVESLSEAMGGKYEIDGTEEQAIDETIYFYVEDANIVLTAKEIIENCLDVDMTLIEEIFE